MGITGTILGFVLRASFLTVILPPLAGVLSSLACVLLVYFVSAATFRRMDELETQRKNMRKGARGERIVEEILEKLPDTFCVLNDVTVQGANLDHIVIGPSGVFALETKSWRGVVGSDGKRELTLNDRSTDAPEVSRFVGRMMALREKVELLLPGDLPFFHAVMVFTAAKVTARFGTTGHACCIHDEQLAKYITEYKYEKKLSPGEVESIAQILACIARTVPEFREQAEPAKEVAAGMAKAQSRFV
jgi:hypothetical protein